MSNAKPTRWTMTEIEKRAKAAHQKWLQKYYPDVAATSAAAAKPKGSFAIADDGSFDIAPLREEAPNALDEQTLRQTEIGRRVLSLRESLRHARACEALAAPFVRAAEADLDTLRRALSDSDYLARAQAAARIPFAMHVLRQWRIEHAGYQSQVARLEYMLADLARVLPL